jgi:hypothetical protein
VLDPRHFLAYVVRPSLDSIGLGSPAAERLLLGTAIVESRLTWLRQHGDGPARGVYQIEPATHDDIWANYLAYRDGLANRVARLAGERPRVDQLAWNLGYATAIARLVYYRRPEPLPHADDLAGLARYWKAHFNTALGAGSPEDFLTRAGPILENL